MDNCCSWLVIGYSVKVSDITCGCFPEDVKLGIVPNNVKLVMTSILKWLNYIGIYNWTHDLII